jgi:hypothetical protein
LRRGEFIGQFPTTMVVSARKPRKKRSLDQKKLSK